MTSHWDEFSKSLAEESLPRRESLRRLGFLFAGAVLSPLAAGTAWAAGKQRPAQNPCKTFCDRCSRGAPRSQCLTACGECGGPTSHLCGSCGNYVCCAAGTTCCYGGCVDATSDFYNCGACGNVCDEAGPYGIGECVAGACVYHCPEYTSNCNGVCAFLPADPFNCGACGNVCGPDTPDCMNGVCGDYCAPGYTLCWGTSCRDLNWDPTNCGACGHSCGGGLFCSLGFCTSGDPWGG